MNNLGGIVFLVIVIGITTLLVIVGSKNARIRREQDEAEGVVSVLRGEGLRLTATELIEGYRAEARHHPLKGLVARAEDSGTLN